MQYMRTVPLQTAYSLDVSCKLSKSVSDNVPVAAQVSLSDNPSHIFIYRYRRLRHLYHLMLA